MYQVDAQVDGAAAVRRARAIVITALCLLLVTKTGDAVNSGPGQVPFVVALFVLPLLYVIPATGPWWTRHRWWLLGAQAVLAERLRVARDTHDLLGLGLSAVALKTDVILALLGRDDAAARGQIAEVRRVCAAARTDVRLVAGQARPLSLAAELAAVGEVLASAGVRVRTGLGGGPVPEAVGAVLAVVLREAATNVLRHSSARWCVIETAAGGGVVRLRVRNDGAGPRAGDGRAGQGLANLAARLEAAGGRLASHHAGGRFELTAEIPLPAAAP
jgi:two-component system sensor histidine kinase DesK